MSLKLTDTMIKAAMFLGDYGEAALSRELFSEIERLLAQEREKVRETCADIAENPYGDEVEACSGDEPAAVGSRIAHAILQLDLTKLDKGGEEKG